MQDDLLCIITALMATAWRRLTQLYLECALYKVSDALLLNYVYSNNFGPISSSKSCQLCPM